MAIGDPYITVEELKTVMEVTSTDEDVLIGRCVKAASRALERRSGWPTFWNTGTAVLRSVDTVGKVVPVRQTGYSKLLLRTGIASLSGFVVTGNSTAALLPGDALEEGRPFDSIRLPYGSAFGSNGTLDITAVWGWPSVPDDIVFAAQIQAHRFYRRKGSPEGVAGSAEWGITRIPALDPDILAILKGGGFMRAGIG